MGRLSDILQNGDGDRIRRDWDSIEAAGDYEPLPPGTYVARVASGELFTAKTKGTPGYKLTFLVLEGEYVGRKIWHNNWLTGAVLPMTKRDLGRLGVTSMAQLELPLPKGIRCAVKVALRKSDDGTEYNEVKSFEVLGIDPPDRDPFAPENVSTGPMPPTLDSGAEPPGPDASDGTASSPAIGTP